MYFAFFFIWIIFNGQITLEIAIFGAVIAAAMYAFICKFMGYSVKRDIIVMKSIPGILHYVFVLIVEIVKANLAVCRMILSSKYEMEPALVTFRTHLKTNTARVALANSITLTPGTITVTLEGDEYTVHCLDKSLAEGMNTSIFVTLLERLEAGINE